MDMNSTVTSYETSYKRTLFSPFSVFASHSANCCISTNAPSFKGPQCAHVFAVLADFSNLYMF